MPALVAAQRHIRAAGSPNASVRLHAGPDIGKPSRQPLGDAGVSIHVLTAGQLTLDVHISAIVD